MSRAEHLISQTDAWRTLATACDLQIGDRTLRCVSLHLLTPRAGLEAVLHGGRQRVRELDAVNSARSEESKEVSEWTRKPSER